MRIVKTCSDALYQLRWLRALPSECRPSKLDIGLYPNEYSYDMLLGESPSISDVWLTLRQYVWSRGAYLGIARVEYVNYCNEAAKDLPHPTLRTIFDELLTAKLTSVSRCHGDATVSNAIREHDSRRIVLLDPGHARGLPCRELDESKLMQSMDGWGYARYGKKSCGGEPHPWKMKRIHYVLLLTHYVRLLKHNHPRNALTFARKRIDELVELLSWRTTQSGLDFMEGFEDREDLEEEKNNT